MNLVLSRHDSIKSSDLRRLSLKYQQQRRAGRESQQQLQKMLRELRYFQQLNQKLSQEMTRGKRQVRLAEGARQRHAQDSQDLQQLRLSRQQQQEQNYQLALRVRRERDMKVRAVRRNSIARANLAQASRCESRRLRDMKEQIHFQQYIRNRERVEEIVEFQNQLKERALREREKQIQIQMQGLRASILREKEATQARGACSVEVRDRLQALTESSSGKVRGLEQMRGYLQKFRSPYYSPLRRLRCGTQGSSSRQQTTLLLTQGSEV